jgi:hypothetical protein
MKWAEGASFVTLQFEIRPVVPVDSSFTVKALRKNGLTMLYNTAGKYYGEKDAVSDLDNLLLVPVLLEATRRTIHLLRCALYAASGQCL